jgi:methionyl-tRNA formyltransferase
MRIVFMGTPEFAVPSLEAIVKAGFEVVGVITAPDKPAGRGKKLQMSAVKTAALALGLPVLQPEKLKAPEFLETLRGLKADLQVVVAFRMLPEAVWQMPPLGTFNLHASLLPKYRGAAPINWAIINGEAETGVTTFMLRHEIDTGPVMFQTRTAIQPDDNAGTVYERLMHEGAMLVVKTIQAIAAGNIPQIPQDLSQPAPHAPKIFRETCQIDWQRPAQELHNFVRGLAPYPSAWGEIAGQVYKIQQTALPEMLPAQILAEAAPGSFYTDHKKLLLVRTGEGWLSILQLQPEGKKSMPIQAFLAGNKL